MSWFLSLSLNSRACNLFNYFSMPCWRMYSQTRGNSNTMTLLYHQSYCVRAFSQKYCWQYKTCFWSSKKLNVQNEVDYRTMLWMSPITINSQLKWKFVTRSKRKCLHKQITKAHRDWHFDCVKVHVFRIFVCISLELFQDDKHLAIKFKAGTYSDH